MDRKNQRQENIENVDENMLVDTPCPGYIQDTENIWRNIMSNWQRQRIQAVVQLVCYIVHFVRLLDIQAMIVNKPPSNLDSQRDVARKNLMARLIGNEISCHNILCMVTYAFALLCEKLRVTGILKDYRHVAVEEQVAKFLHVLGQNFHTRPLGFFFQCFGETISRHFHNVLRVVIARDCQLLKQPTGVEFPPQILNSNRFYPYFKDCVGAINGTHIHVKVPRDQASRFCGRKEWPTQNVLATCSFDMKFTYVLSDWEGTASDSRILRNALTRKNKLIFS